MARAAMYLAMAPTSNLLSTTASVSSAVVSESLVVGNRIVDDFAVGVFRAADTDANPPAFLLRTTAEGEGIPDWKLDTCVVAAKTRDRQRKYFIVDCRYV